MHGSALRCSQMLATAERQRKMSAMSKYWRTLLVVASSMSSDSVTAAGEVPMSEVICARIDAYVPR